MGVQEEDYEGGGTNVVFQKLYLKVRDPSTWLLRCSDRVPSVKIFRATMFVRCLVRSSSVMRYVAKAENISSKNASHSGPLLGDPIKRVRGDASRNTKIA
jgi:hypothetical protein